MTETDDDGQDVEDAGVEVGEPGVGAERARRRRRAARCRRTRYGRQLEERAVGLLRDDVLLLEELADLGEQLQRAVGAGLHGPSRLCMKLTILNRKR